MALLITTWKWGDKYKKEDVDKLIAGIDRNLDEHYEFLCFADQPDGLSCKTYPIKDHPLLRVRGCFARLRLFDPQTQAEIGAKPGDRVVCIDLDVVITGDLFPLFHRPDNFVILTGANSANPCPYNGSVWMLRAGYRPDVWQDFSLEAASKVTCYEFPDDQGWFHHMMPNENGWQVGSESGIYAFQKPGWPQGSDALPSDARMVVFPGWRSPARFAHLPWIRQYWCT